MGLPCAAMTGPGLVLGLAAAGVRVEVAPCSSCSDTCRLERTMEVVRRVVAAAYQYQTAHLGDAARRRVGQLPGTWNEPYATNRAALALLDRGPTGSPAGGNELPISVSVHSSGAGARPLPGSGLISEPESGSVGPVASSWVEDAPGGSVDIEAASCTGCGACALACPTGAIASSAAQAPLVVDPTGCLGCGRCVDACPEDAVVVHRGLDLAALLAGPSLVVPASPPRICSRCGVALAPDPLLSAVLQRLAARPGAQALLASLARCTVCARDGNTDQGTSPSVVSSGDLDLLPSLKERDSNVPPSLSRR